MFVAGLCVRGHVESPARRAQDASAQPRPGNAELSLGVCQRLGSTPPFQRARLPGPLPHRVGGRRDISVDGHSVRAFEPCPGSTVEDPAKWKWSTYRGYSRDRRRLEWVAYDELLAAWAGEFGGSGSEPAAAYRRYVTAGLLLPPGSPWTDAYHGWILGSQKFVDRVRAMVSNQSRRNGAGNRGGCRVCRSRG